MIDDIQTYERVILYDLFKENKPIDAFVFHQKYQLSPAQIIFFIRKYSKEGLAERIENTLQLTKVGREYVWRNRFEIFVSKRTRSWRSSVENKDWKNVSDLALQKPNYAWMDKKITSLKTDGFLKEIRRDSDTGR